MSQVIQDNKYIPVKILLISCLTVLLLFIWQGNKGLNLWDEGFLWYGAQRVLLGEVPILDFMAYDPGRYYWSAALLSILGDSGIMSARAAAAIFQALGLFVGLLLVAQSTKSNRKSDIIFWLISTAILVVWMFPRYRFFDISLSIFLIGALTYLIGNPTPKRYIIAGTCVGLVAVFGRNHGVYGAISSLGVIAWLTIKNSSGPGFIKGALQWGVGVVIGFLPVIFMMLLIPGFATAFLESIRFLFERKTTNLPLPVPWPWTVNFAAVSASKATRGVLIGLFFAGTLVFGVLSLVWVTRQKLKGKAVPPVLVAAAFLQFPYAHYAFSRADTEHLALGIFPLLIGCLVIISAFQSRIKWLLAPALFAASFLGVHKDHPGWKCMKANKCTDVEISGKTLEVTSSTASEIALLRQLVAQYAPAGQNFLATPFWPGAYSLFEKKSPMWAIYALWRRGSSFEEKEIERIKSANPAFAIVLDLPLDGREELRFSHTHPIIYKYIVDNYELTPQTHGAMQVFVPRLPQSTEHLLGSDQID